jgi:glutamate synthase domain-containing protein 2
MVEIIGILFGILIFFIIYDKYIQRKHQLLIQYPVIGRMRYVLEAISEPFRQYFGDEHFYESKDKVDWVYKASREHINFTSFAPEQPLPRPKFLLKHANAPLNHDEVSNDFSVTFGENREIPFTSSSVIIRSAMSDGAISPEGTRAFTIGSKNANFPINTGEGSLTSNFLTTHRDYNEDYMETIKLSPIQRMVFHLLRKINYTIPIEFFKSLLIDNKIKDTYDFNTDKLEFYRVDWNADLSHFPKTVPTDLPDIIFQMSSGLYGVRDKNGKFDPQRYKKVMTFCKMTEIKIAQGAKQTGGKLIADKVTDSVAYFRGVEPNQNLYSPNRFPYANTIEELFDFIARLQELSKKPVGFKFVISDKDNIEPIVNEMKRRIDNNIKGIPDFLSIDGGDGGSATAPISLMERVGLHVKDAVYLADKLLKEQKIRDKVRIIASSKILTPDDIAIILALGADAVGIGRGFMMSCGCIRARLCSGATGRHCPVGLATQNPKARKSFLIYKNSKQIVNYHNELIEGLKTILAVMGLKHYTQLEPHYLNIVDKNGVVSNDIGRIFEKKLDLDHEDKQSTNIN